MIMEDILIKWLNEDHEQGIIPDVYFLEPEQMDIPVGLKQSVMNGECDLEDLSDIQLSLLEGRL